MQAVITADAIGFQTDPQPPVYVNGHVMPENKRLFTQGLARKNQMNWQFLWGEDCRIKGRKAPGDRIFSISQVSDLAIIS